MVCMQEQERSVAKDVRALLGQLVIESNSFKDNAEKMGFIAHGGFGPCRCPQCQGKIAVYRKGSGAHKGEPAIKKFSCSCDYSNDAVGFYSALMGLDNGESFKALAERVKGLDGERVEAIKRMQQIAWDETRKRNAENITTIRQNTLWGRKMPPERLALLEERALDIDALEKDGVLERIGFLPNQELKSRKEDGLFSVSGFVFDKEDGVKIRRTVDWPKPAFESGKRLRFLSWGTSSAFGSESLSDSDKAVFITEGEFDALSIISHGKKAIALSGVTNHGAFDEYVEKEDPDRKRVYVVCFDSDKAGESGTQSFLHHVQDKGYRCFAANLNGSQKDINDSDQKAPRQLDARLALASRIAFAWADGALEEGEIGELMSTWKRIDALAATDRSSAIKQVERFQRHLDSIYPSADEKRITRGSGIERVF